MCSRFENKESGISIFEKLKKDSMGNFILEADEDTKKINIAPTNRIISVFRNKKDEYSIKNVFWGIQFDKQAKSPIIFNSRIETISEKKYWKQVFSKSRCLIPATAFYEWKEINKTKIPHKIEISGNEIFYIASIFIKSDDNIYNSMITTTPNKYIKPIHNRMPVILGTQEALDFLEAEPEKAMKFCKPFDEKVEMKIEIAEEILTEKQKKALQ